MKNKFSSFIKTSHKFLQISFINKSREFYSGLISLIVLLLSVYGLIIVFVSFENSDYFESENVFFSGIILEPTIFHDYRDTAESLPYESISKERRNYIEIYRSNSTTSRFDSILNYFKGYKYDHTNKEDEIISIESNYHIADTCVIYQVTFRLNEFINEKNISDFKRKIKLVIRTPHNKSGKLYTQFTRDDKEIHNVETPETIDYVTAYQLFEIDNKEFMPESSKVNDEYKVYSLTIENFPFKMEYILTDIPHRAYFDDYEMEMVNMVDAKSKQNFTIKNNLSYSSNIDILNINPNGNIVNESSIDNNIILQNIPYKEIYMDGQKLSVEIWNDVDRFTFPVDQSQTEIYIKYRNIKKELQKELVSVVLSILIGGGLSVFLTIFLSPRSAK